MSSNDEVQCCEWKDKYRELESRVASMQQEMNELRAQIRKDRKEVRSHCQSFYKQDNTVKTEIKELKERVDILGNTVIRMDQQLQEAHVKILDMQTRSMRKNLVISGLSKPNNETATQLHSSIKNFIRSELQIEQEIPIKIAHRLNYVDGSDYRPVIVKLTTIDHKLLLLSHGPNLKGKKNDKNRYYYLNEQLPDKYAEEKRYAQQWIKENKAKPISNQSQMKIYKIKLRINNTPYKKKVHPPSPAEILRMDAAEISQTMKASTVFGDSTLIEGSEFISYAAAVSSVENVS